MTTSSRLYKRDSTGGIRTWEFETVGTNQWRTIAGGPGRKPVVSAWTTCTGKQGRSDIEQASFEANAAFNQKLAREYRLTEAELSSVPTSPMLAKAYEGWPEMTPVVFSQPKLDGIRCTINKHGAFSREYQRFHNVDHIIEALAPVIAAHPYLSFDGELYNHELREEFGKISSSVRKTKPTPAARELSRALIQYHVYDLGIPDITFADRNALMFRTIFGENTFPSIVPVVTHKVSSVEELDAHYGEYLEQGYEGQMVRLDAPYEFDKRSSSLLKRKEFLTAEFKLLRIEEGQGNWAGYAKRVVFALPDGRECGAGIRGTQAQAVELQVNNLLSLQNGTADKSLVTIRYFTPTPDGMPRFPVAIDFHFGGRKD